MYRKLKQMALMFFTGFGIASVVFAIVNYINPLKFTMQYLWWLMLLVFVISVCASLIFREGVGPKSLWIRRGIVISIAILTTILTTYLFGFSQDLRMLVKDSIRIIIAIAGISFLFYWFADKAEKRRLQQINDKLRQMNKEE